MDLDSAGKSITKSLVALVCSAGIDISLCGRAKSYLIDGDDFPLVFYSGKDLVRNRAEGMPLHCVSVRGHPESQLIVGYFEIFGVYRVLISLSDDYSGAPFQSSYGIDPISGESVDVDIRFGSAGNHLKELLNGAALDQEDIVSRLEVVMESAIKRNGEYSQKVATEEALARAVKKLGLKDGDPIPENFGSAVVAEMMPYIKWLAIHMCEQQAAYGKYQKEVWSMKSCKYE